MQDIATDGVLSLKSSKPVTWWNSLWQRMFLTLKVFTTKQTPLRLIVDSGILQILDFQDFKKFYMMFLYSKLSHRLWIFVFWVLIQMWWYSYLNSMCLSFLESVWQFTCLTSVISFLRYNFVFENLIWTGIGIFVLDYKIWSIIVNYRPK